jgi:hypothetical protein
MFLLGEFRVRVELKNALSLDMFGNYSWYAFNTNVCFRGFVNIASLKFLYKKDPRQAAIDCKEIDDVPNFGHSEVLIKMTENFSYYLHQ